jgi:hypothetical protein
MITASKLAIAIAVAASLTATAAGESFATPLASRALAVKAAAPAAATVVRYRAYGYGPYLMAHTLMVRTEAILLVPRESVLGPLHLEHREWLLLRWLARAPSPVFVSLA